MAQKLFRCASCNRGLFYEDMQQGTINAKCPSCKAINILVAKPTTFEPDNNKPITGVDTSNVLENN